MTAGKQPATLTDPNTGKTVTLPILDGTVGPSVIDIRKLYAESGYFTYDPGFTSTASTESKITYIDGDEGVLLYRGYEIGRAHVCTPVTNAHLVCRLLLEKKK